MSNQIEFCDLTQANIWATNAGELHIADEISIREDDHIVAIDNGSSHTYAIRVSTEDIANQLVTVLSVVAIAEQVRQGKLDAFKGLDSIAERAEEATNG